MSLEGPPKKAVVEDAAIGYGEAAPDKQGPRTMGHNNPDRPMEATAAAAEIARAEDQNRLAAIYEDLQNVGPGTLTPEERWGVNDADPSKPKKPTGDKQAHRYDVLKGTGIGEMTDDEMDKILNKSIPPEQMAA